MRTFLVVAAALFAMPALGVEPTAETSRAFDQYVTAAEKQLHEGAFLYSDAHPEAKTAARNGQTVVVQQRSGEVRVTGGLIHDWLGFSFFPGAHLAEVRAPMQDYANYKSVYAPDVIDSKLLARDGDNFRVFLKMQNRQFITLTYDSEYAVSYGAPAADRLEIVSHSTRIQQAGNDQGFLWRLNSYWRFVEADGGVYAECRSISLSRGIPFGFGWLHEPLEKFPRDSMVRTMESTRRAATSGLARR
ncbi:MAG: hypothetical protein ACLQLH_10655 [Terracidiphilus sp.]